jgi:hypothetical protein
MIPAWPRKRSEAKERGVFPESEGYMMATGH